MHGDHNLLVEPRRVEDRQTNRKHVVHQQQTTSNVTHVLDSHLCRKRLYPKLLIAIDEGQFPIYVAVEVDLPICNAGE